MSSTENENRVSWLLHKLRSNDVGASKDRVALVERCASIYEDNEVLQDGKALPLDCACPAAPGCWADPRAVRPPRTEASVAVPWIGPGYPQSAIAAIAINLNSYGGLGAHWWIIRGAIEKLAAGQRVQFYYRAGAYLGAVLASLEGRPQEAEPSPELAASGWSGTAFVDAVKCSPVGQASKPTAAMWTNCPGRYLLRELDVLAPRVILTMGIEPGNVAQGLLDFVQAADADGFARGTATVAGRTVDVLRCRHPGRSERRWRASYDSLLDSLRRNPVTVVRTD